MKKILLLFGELEDEDIDWLIDNGRCEEVLAGSVLIRENEPVAALYVVLEGELSVVVGPRANKEIACLGIGEVVGEMSFVDTRPPSATVQAKKDAIVLAIPRNLLSLKLKQDAEFASRFYLALAVILSNRLRGTVSQINYDVVAQKEGTSKEDDYETSDDFLLARARFDWLLKRMHNLEEVFESN